MPRRYSGSWMWAEACESLEQAERLQRQFFQLGRTRARQPTWEPPVDMVETGEGLRISVALPGVPPERIEVHAEPGALVVTAQRPMPLESRSDVIRRLEIPYGRFERRIELPAGRFELRGHEAADGCVHILLLRR